MTDHDKIVEHETKILSLENAVVEIRNGQEMLRKDFVDGQRATMEKIHGISQKIGETVSALRDDFRKAASTCKREKVHEDLYSKTNRNTWLIALIIGGLILAGVLAPHILPKLFNNGTVTAGEEDG